ncbi:LysR family transcriptional regulator [Achromobacter sp. AGC78]|uniref:LysR family transcriptional regulator n=1 Tax=Achromobacter spanius TaxID=217203 RepID=A0AA42LPG0_9BURK|nr:LysR family transcriptional regulator [Achromobacter spanius]MDH0737135.1 LysR family transcriptional regulator [Achromobacter spanius]
MRYFLTIAALGSMSKAADELGISQPSLSRQMAALEAYLGRPVFDRNGRGMVLSEAGKTLHRAVAPAFQLIDDAIAKARDASSVGHASLRIAAVHTLTYYFLGDLVSAVTHEGGDANLHLMARSSPEVVDLVASGKAELGFVYDSAVASPGLVSVDLFEDEMCLIVRLDDTSYGDVANLWQTHQRLVAFPEHYALRKMLQHSRLNYVVSAETDTVDSALELVSAGIGNCLLPCRIPDRLLLDHKLKKVPITGGTLARKVVAIHRDGYPLFPLAALTLNIARRLSSRSIE